MCFYQIHKTIRCPLAPFTLAPTSNLDLDDVEHLRALGTGGVIGTSAVLGVDDERCVGDGKVCLPVTGSMVVTSVDNKICISNPPYK